MNKTTIALVGLFVALAAVAVYFQREKSDLRFELNQLRDSFTSLHADKDRLQAQLVALESRFQDTRETTRGACKTNLPTGLYRLMTTTGYGSNTGEYEIHHASVQLAGLSTLNVGMRLNSFGIPDLYLDYDGDGRIDIALAARFAREIPLVGTTIADRLIANSSSYQELYSVFTCEWENAHYTSADDMANSSNALWNLVQARAENIATWIRSEGAKHPAFGPANP